MTHSLRDEDAVARLGSSRDGTGSAFLGRHHLAAAERFEQLIRRAQLASRVTMSYDPTRVGGGGSFNGVEVASQGAADARLQLSRLA